ncbi:hypothetical protein EMN47_03830 [Prolixibacteraceae bacterium JC049]|nr:hypothetical protein [Prolixibacteraceae bacterium JC049]
MQSILTDFIEDLNDVIGVNNLHKMLDEKKNLSPVEGVENDFQAHFIELLDTYKSNTQGVHKIPGTLIPYVAGRFEVFVRTVFEETATQVAKIHVEFKKLPSDFQKSLISDTSKVIADPRKFQHGEGARDSFIRNLHNNIHNNDLSAINYQCISATDRNMKSKILTELFNKISYKRIWDDIASQANIRLFFYGEDTNKTKTECQKKLDGLMDTRNSIAHPSTDVTWLSSNELAENIKFLKEFATAMTNVCPLFIKQKEREQLAAHAASN